MNIASRFLGPALSLVSALALVPACASDDPGRDDTMTTPSDTAPVVLASVSGTVIDRSGAPLANKIVAIAGEMLVTDSEGHFTATNVTAPYDVTVTETGSSMVTSVVGLTTASPQIMYTYWPENRSGAVSGSFVTSVAMGDTFVFGATTPTERDTWQTTSPTMNSRPISWRGPTTTTAHVTALKYTTGADGLPNAYQAMGTATVEVEAGKTTSGVSMTAFDPAEATITGTASYPAGTTYGSVAAFSAVNGGVVELGRADDVADFSFVVPSGVGITTGFTAFAHTPEGQSTRFVHDVPTDAQGLTLDVPAPPHLESPGLDTVLAPGSTITWTDPHAKYFVVEIGQYDPNQNGWPWYTQTLTSAHSFTIPDLTDLGLHWDPTRPAVLWILAYDVPWTLDETAGHSLDELLDIVASDDALPNIDGSVAFYQQGWTFATPQ